jgi:putative colanic acid biosynthesis acetyltransferase WcaF
MKEVNLNKYDNSWYKPGSFLKRFIWHLFSNIFINTTLPFPIKLKVTILRLFGTKIGQNVVIKPSVNIKYPWFLIVGDNVWIGENVWIDNLTTVSIGKNVCISQGALLLTGNHNYKKIKFDLMLGEIKIEDGAWIGAKTVVCPNLVIGSHAILSVGSIATTDLKAFGIYQGNPAIWVRDRNLID